ncbi:MAG TPA: CocE/NonD family hydrolase, partial [Polyangiaceae bacterium]|nr:CocE/NonD family hydrolase [Polyangiaceae bacterium]
MRLFACVLTIATCTACSSNDAASGTTTGTGGSSTSSAGGGGNAGSGGGAGTACELSNVQVVSQEPTHVVERFSYPSGDLRIEAEVCRPPGRGPFPVLIWNHGGFQGIGAGDRQLCAAFAQNAGWAMVMSEYRGEGGSDGPIEVCLGEVDDALALAECTTDQSWADATRMQMAGLSHGGCITLRAAQRGAPIVAAVDIFGPTDWKAEHAFWTAELAAAPNGPFAAAYQLLLDVMETAAGGPPSSAGAAYDARSPLNFDVDGYGGSLLIVHGVDDALVPPEQSCALVEASRGFEARHYDASATTPLPTPPAGCESSSLIWLATPKPSPAWP